MASEEILAFLNDVDVELARHAKAGETLDLHLLGRAAMILGYGVQLMTKDVDVVHVAGSRLLDIAVKFFGKDDSARPTRRFYLETVASGLPPLPIGFQGRCIDVAGPWKIIRAKLPEAHDLVVTKLRRFHQGDREDVRILCDIGGVDASTLQERFDLAYTFSDQDDPRVASAATNLRSVQDYLEGRRKTV